MDSEKEDVYRKISEACDLYCATSATVRWWKAVAYQSMYGKYKLHAVEYVVKKDPWGGEIKRRYIVNCTEVSNSLHQAAITLRYKCVKYGMGDQGLALLNIVLNYAVNYLIEDGELIHEKEEGTRGGYNDKNR